MLIKSITYSYEMKVFKNYDVNYSCSNSCCNRCSKYFHARLPFEFVFFLKCDNHCVLFVSMFCVRWIVIILLFVFRIAIVVLRYSYLVAMCTNSS